VNTALSSCNESLCAVASGEARLGANIDQPIMQLNRLALEAPCFSSVASEGLLPRVKVKIPYIFVSSSREDHRLCRAIMAISQGGEPRVFTPDDSTKTHFADMSERQPTFLPASQLHTQPRCACYKGNGPRLRCGQDWCVRLCSRVSADKQCTDSFLRRHAGKEHDRTNDTGRDTEWWLERSQGGGSWSWRPGTLEANRSIAVTTDARAS